MVRTDITLALESFSRFKQTVHQSMTPLYKDYDISAQQWMMLALISKSKKGITTSELAEIARITPGAVSQFVEQLDAKGFINREQDELDRRVTNITIPPKAQKRIDELIDAYKQQISELFDCLSDDELRSFVSILSKVGDHISLNTNQECSN
ncbi:MAG: MarR family transcriptional regulator [Candidatus Saccharimonadales bacterium]